jgi:hypothetical protein
MSILDLHARPSYQHIGESIDYRTVRIKAGRQKPDAADPVPDDLSDALIQIRLRETVPRG